MLHIDSICLNHYLIALSGILNDGDGLRNDDGPGLAPEDGLQRLWADEVRRESVAKDYDG